MEEGIRVQRRQPSTGKGKQGRQYRDSRYKESSGGREPSASGSSPLVSLALFALHTSCRIRVQIMNPWQAHEISEERRERLKTEQQVKGMGIMSVTVSPGLSLSLSLAHSKRDHLSTPSPNSIREACSRRAGEGMCLCASVLVKYALTQRVCVCITYHAGADADAAAALGFLWTASD